MIFYKIFYKILTVVNFIGYNTDEVIFCRNDDLKYIAKIIKNWFRN